MKMTIETKELTEGLEQFSQDLILSAETQDALKEALPTLEGAAAFVSWIISEYCNTVSNVAESEIAAALKEFKLCIEKTETGRTREKVKADLNSKYGLLTGKSLKELIYDTPGISSKALAETYAGETSKIKYYFYSLADAHLITEASYVNEWNIRRYKGNWILDIDYFDVTAEQDIRDSMELSEADSEDWVGDIKVIALDSENGKLWQVM